MIYSQEIFRFNYFSGRPNKVKKSFFFLILIDQHAGHIGNKNIVLVRNKKILLSVLNTLHYAIQSTQDVVSIIPWFL